QEIRELVGIVCAGCGATFWLCTRCYRGHSYCSDWCRKTARKASLSRAGRKYQSSREGRRGHADRQRRYRSGAQKVTHHTRAPASRPISQSSGGPSLGAVLSGSRIFWEMVIDGATDLGTSGAKRRGRADFGERGGERNGTQSATAAASYEARGEHAAREPLALVLSSFGRCHRCGRGGSRGPPGALGRVAVGHR